MTNLSLQFDVDDNANEEQIAHEISTLLNSLNMVAEADTMPGEKRMTGMEVAAIIAAVALVIKSSREIAEELPRLIEALRDFPRKIRGLKTAKVEVEGQWINLEKISKEQLNRLIELASEG